MQSHMAIGEAKQILPKPVLKPPPQLLNATEWTGAAYRLDRLHETRGPPHLRFGRWFCGSNATVSCETGFRQTPTSLRQTKSTFSAAVDALVILLYRPSCSLFLMCGICAPTPPGFAKIRVGKNRRLRRSLDSNWG